jgi:hypothetical protein
VNILSVGKLLCPDTCALFYGVFKCFGHSFLLLAKIRWPVSKLIMGIPLCSAGLTGYSIATRVIFQILV